MRPLLCVKARAEVYTMEPIFAVRREDGWRTSDMRSAAVRQVAAGGGVLLISTSDGRVVRWGGAGLAAEDDPGAGSAVPEIVEMERRGSEFRVHGLHVDPTGNHALVTAVLAGVGLTFYVGASTGAGSSSGGRGVAARVQAKELPGLTRSVVESVAWNAAELPNDARVGPFLVGTAGGRIVEVAVERGREASVRVHEPLDAYASPLACLRLEKFAQVSADRPSRYYAMAVTNGPPLRVFHFNGGATICALPLHVLAGELDACVCGLRAGQLVTFAALS